MSSSNNNSGDSPPQQSNTQSAASDTQSAADNTQSAASDIETSSENYFPNIQRYLETGEGPKPTVLCAICLHNKVIIRGLQEPTPADNPDDFEQSKVLACGHVFGRECAEHWIVSTIYETNSATSPPCPLCRNPAVTDPLELGNYIAAAILMRMDDAPLFEDR